MVVAETYESYQAFQWAWVNHKVFGLFIVSSKMLKKLCMHVILVFNTASAHSYLPTFQMMLFYLS